MSITSIPTLLVALRQNSLLEPKQWEDLAQTVQTRFSDPRSLAGELIQRGWITPYQANQLFQGRAEELMLGPYVILERLGEGGMGTVYKARHSIMRRIVALKVIRKERLASPAAVKRFYHEIRAAAHLDHPNIVHAFDADEVRGTHIFVMEYVDGTDLGRLVKDQGPLPVATACDYIRQAALGLQHAHERGLIHRDIKPSNLLVTFKSSFQDVTLGAVKILDMGLARLTNPLGEESSTMTHEDAVVGTPDYISPEQARQSHEVDIRTDVYSLGCTLYYLLSGRPPFPGGSLGEKLVKHQLGEPAPVERLRPEVPAGVAGVVRKMMAKDVRDRYQTPGEVAEVLASGLSSGKWPAATRPASPTSALLPRPPVATLVTAGQADGAAPMALVAGPGLLPAVPVAVTPAPSETLVEGRSPILKETLFAGVPVIALAIYIAVVAGLALIGLLFSRR